MKNFDIIRSGLHPFKARYALYIPALCRSWLSECKIIQQESAAASQYACIFCSCGSFIRYNGKGRFAEKPVEAFIRKRQRAGVSADKPAARRTLPGALKYSAVNIDAVSFVKPLTDRCFAASPPAQPISSSSSVSVKPAFFIPLSSRKKRFPRCVKASLSGVFSIVALSFHSQSPSWDSAYCQKLRFEVR